MRKKMGRPPQHAAGDTTITMRVSADVKNRIVDMADGYDMTITEYLLTLVDKDVSDTPAR
jgi:hypothetical protein